MKVLDRVAAADNEKVKERGNWRGEKEVLGRGKNSSAKSWARLFPPVFSPNTTGREMRPWTSLHVSP